MKEINEGKLRIKETLIFGNIQFQNLDLNACSILSHKKDRQIISLSLAIYGNPYQKRESGCNVSCDFERCQRKVVRDYTTRVPSIKGGNVHGSIKKCLQNQSLFTSLRTFSPPHSYRLQYINTVSHVTTISPV